jgi:hypothetical protein
MKVNDFLMLLRKFEETAFLKPHSIRNNPTCHCTNHPPSLHHLKHSGSENIGVVDLVLEQTQILSLTSFLLNRVAVSLRALSDWDFC